MINGTDSNMFKNRFKGIQTCLRTDSHEQDLERNTYMISTSKGGRIITE
jgi:hypothetical protein